MRDRGTGYQILAEVANFSDEPVKAHLDVELNDEVLDSVPLSIAPGKSWRRVLDKVRNEGGRLHARLDRADALATDNEAWAILAPREPLDVAVFTSGESFADLYVERVLEANPLVHQPPTVVKGLASDVTAGDRLVRVYHRRVPRRLPPGPILVINPVGSCDLWDSGEVIESPIVGTTDRASPLLAYVTLENAQITESRRLTPKSKANVLVSLATGEPLYLVFDRAEGKVLVLAASLDDPGDLPLRTAFPILVGNALSWIEGSGGNLSEAIATGAVVELPRPVKGFSSGLRKVAGVLCLRSMAVSPSARSTGRGSGGSPLGPTVLPSPRSPATSPVLVRATSAHRRFRPFLCPPRTSLACSWHLHGMLSWSWQ